MSQPLNIISYENIRARQRRRFPGLTPINVLTATREPTFSIMATLFASWNGVNAKLALATIAFRDLFFEEKERLAGKKKARCESHFTRNGRIQDICQADPCTTLNRVFLFFAVFIFNRTWFSGHVRVVVRIQRNLFIPVHSLVIVIVENVFCFRDFVSEQSTYFA